MTDAEILLAFIEKAVKNGVNVSKEWGYWGDWWDNKSQAERMVFCEGQTKRKDYSDYRSIIFNLTLFKKVVGDHKIGACGRELMPKNFKKIYEKSKHNPMSDDWTQMELDNPQYCYDQDDPECGCYIVPAFEYHIQQAVIKEQPLKYLERFV